MIIMTDNDQKELGNTLWKIADDLRGGQSPKLEALKPHKKGMMQQLFPNTEAENL